MHLSCQNGLEATSEHNDPWDQTGNVHSCNGFILGHGASPLRILPVYCVVIDFSGCQFTQIGDVGFYLPSTGRGVWSSRDETDHNYS